ncbi:MAG: peptidyl-prolyl cis-trans isomerase [Verrucomicrobia bacterium]|nr:peptidyl-prolyl cis-trans isomerase [Verrucomicrobiota bacterium]
MSDKLDFSLPERKPAPVKTSGTNRFLLICILAAVLGNMFFAVKNRTSPEQAKTPGSLSSEAQKQLALKLEKQNLQTTAADAWREYLRLAAPDDAETAKVYYRIGKLHQEARDYAQALNSFYRSESFYRDKELEPEIGRRTQECLEAMGKFAALRYELSDRVGLNLSASATGEEIVAEIGAQKISKAELDRRIEAAIEQQLSQYAAYLPDEERKKQKETLLSQLSSSTQRMQFLNQYVMEEILYRKARESKLAEDPGTRQLLLDTERSLLAQRVLANELADSIKITSGDLTTYYEANKESFVQPERAQISHILLKDEEMAKEALENLKNGKDFGELAVEISMDAGTAKNQGKIEGWVNKGAAVPGIGNSGDAQKAVFETEAGKVAATPISSDQGLHLILVREKEAEHARPFEEVRNEVYSALRSRKEREIQQKLLSDLKDQYRVVIHQSAFAQEKRESQTE